MKNSGVLKMMRMCPYKYMQYDKPLQGQCPELMGGNFHHREGSSVGMVIYVLSHLP